MRHKQRTYPKQKGLMEKDSNGRRTPTCWKPNPSRAKQQCRLTQPATLREHWLRPRLWHSGQQGRAHPHACGRREGLQKHDPKKKKTE